MYLNPQKSSQARAQIGSRSRSTAASLPSHPQDSLGRDCDLRGSQPAICRGEIAGQPFPAELFWRQVDRRGPEECWPWLGNKNFSGHGSLRFKNRRVSAARAAWSIFHDQPFPDELLACHTCDNPWCVNPAHIWPGTQAENMQDMVAKGRQARRGETCKRGHRYDDHPQPASVTAQGWRRCRKCDRVYEAKKNDRRREARQAARATETQPFPSAPDGVVGVLLRPRRFADAFDRAEDRRECDRGLRNFYGTILPVAIASWVVVYFAAEFVRAALS